MAALVMATTGAAQDLVTNGHFHTDINGWTLGGQGSLAWDPLDWEANPFSGSMRVTLTVGLPGDPPGPPLPSSRGWQCIPLSPSGTYEFGGHIRFPSGQALPGLAAVGLSSYANPTCTDPPLASTQTPVVFSQTTDTWVEVFSSGINLPGGTVAVAVAAAVGTPGGVAGSLDALFDRVRFGLDGTTPVEVQNFTVE